MREFSALSPTEVRRFTEHLQAFSRRDPNVMHQIKRLERAGNQYRLKAARKWVVIFDWEGDTANLTGFRYRGDKGCYKS